MPTLYLPCDSLARAVGADEVSTALITQAKARNLPHPIGYNYKALDQ